MLGRDLLGEILFSLRRNILRTSLTILGILIGIASVVALMTIGESTRRGIVKNIEAIGSNFLIIVPSAGQALGRPRVLTEADVLKIEKIKEINRVAPQIDRTLEVQASGRSAVLPVVGTTADYRDIRNLRLAEGNFINQAHEQGRARVVVLGFEARKAIYGNGQAINKFIKINGFTFRVIGISAVKGAASGAGEDFFVYIPLSAMSRISGIQQLSSINASAASGEEITAAKEQVARVLNDGQIKQKRNQDGFEVLSQGDLIQAADEVTKTLSMLLGAIAGISLLVGGIGIMNMMCTSVLERTREIGLRRAIGAKQKDIGRQMLGESVALCFIGALFGLPIGWAGGYVFSRLSGAPFSLSWYPVLLSVGLALLIGLVFGWLPARQASGLEPIDALRHE